MSEEDVRSEVRGDGVRGEVRVWGVRGEEEEVALP